MTIDTQSGSSIIGVMKRIHKSVKGKHCFCKWNKQGVFVCCKCGVLEAQVLEMIVSSKCKK